MTTRPARQRPATAAALARRIALVETDAGGPQEPARPVDLWLPPSLRRVPAGSPRPKIWIPESYGTPRTEELHARLRSIIDIVREQIESDRERGTNGGSRQRFRYDGDWLAREEDSSSGECAPGPSAPSAVAEAADVEVPHRKQQGKTCGLYALGMVMDHWHEVDPANATALVRDEDLAPVDESSGYRFYNFDPTTERRIYDVALEGGFSARGEVFDATFLAKIAKGFGYRASVHHEATLDELCAVLDRGHPAIVAYDNNDEGNPGLSNGTRAHYAVVQGYFDRDGERFLEVKHSWSRSEVRIWKAETFAASWSQLNTTRVYGTPGDGEMPDGHREPRLLSLPPAGDGLANIRGSLSQKIVEVVPLGEALVGGTEV